MTIDKNKLESWNLALAKSGRVNAREIVDEWNEIFTKRGMPRRAYTTCVSCLKRMVGDILRYYRFQEQQTTEAETNEPIEEKTDEKNKSKIGRKKKSS